jgi:hypothetical protein
MPHTAHMCHVQAVAPLGAFGRSSLPVLLCCAAQYGLLSGGHGKHASQAATCTPRCSKPRARQCLCRGPSQSYRSPSLSCHLQRSARLPQAAHPLLSHAPLLAPLPQPILGVFQKLLASKAHDHEGLELLASLVESCEAGSYQQHLATIWSILFTRLQTSRTPKYVRCLLVAISR